MDSLFEVARVYPLDDKSLRATDRPGAQGRSFPTQRTQDGGSALPGAPSQRKAAPASAWALGERVSSAQRNSSSGTVL